jgi:hypothetical protein
MKNNFKRIHNNIVRIVTSLMKSPIKNISNLLPINENWSDAAEERIKKDLNFISLKDNVYFKQKSYDAKNRSFHILNRLGHIPVNPSRDKYNTKALKETYVYFNDSKEESSNESVNQNSKSSDLFLEDLIGLAHRQRDYIYDSSIINPTGNILSDRPFILHGSKGLGKTFYLNHFYSKYFKELDDNHVLWIRINLVDDYPCNDKEEIIEHWIDAQLTKIVLRYYDKKSDYYNYSNPKKYPLEIIPVLRKEIYDDGELSEMEKKDYIYHIDEIKDSYRKKGPERVLKEKLVNPFIAQKIKRIVAEKGYSLIVALDGYDRLEITKSYKERFETIQPQVVKLLQTHERLGFALLVVSRSRTLSNYITPYGTNLYKEKRLKDISLERIIKRRLSYIKEEIDLVIKDADLSFWGDDWPDHLLNFEDFLLRIDETENSFYDYLDDVLEQNRRAQMQTVQLIYHDFLEKKVEKSYRVTEAMIKSGCIFPPKPYSYFRDEDETIVRRYNDEYSRIFDQYMLPLIYLFPYIKNGKELPHPHGILFGLRILQIIKAHSLRTDSPDNLYAFEIAEILKLLFDYPSDLILEHIEELGEQEVLDLKSEKYLHASEKSFHIVGPLPKMEKILNNFIFQTAYLNLASMRIPLSIKALSINKFEYPYFYADSLDQIQGKLPSSLLMNYITNKVLNTIGIYRLLNYINKKEKEMYFKRIEQIDIGHKKTLDICIKALSMFEFTKIMEDKIILSIKNIIPSIPDALNNLLIFENYLKKYSEKWKTI